MILRKTRALLAGASLSSVISVVPAHALTPKNAPLPANAYIVYAGLQWAWGDSTSIENMQDLRFQGSQGWRVPTTAELNNAPTAFSFLNQGGNVPYNRTDPLSGSYFSFELAPIYTAAQSSGSCAAGYFASYSNACDFADGNGQPFGPWAGTAGQSQSFSDQLFVRSPADVPTPSAPGVSGAPVPGIWALLVAGVALIGATLRLGRRQGALPAA